MGRTTGPRVEHYSMMFGNRTFQLNSKETAMGRDDANRYLGDFSGVYTFTSEDMASVVGYAGFIIHDIYNSNVEQATIAQSNGIPVVGRGGELDFKNKVYELLGIERNSLIEIDGTTYNANEAGNYLWGLALEYYGSYIPPNAYAQAGSKIQGRDDEPHEQKAIDAGRKKAHFLLTDDEFADYVFKNRIYYREEANETEGSEDVHE